MFSVDVLNLQVLEALTSYEPDMLTCSATPAGVVDSSAKTLALLADLYDRELVGVIGWAKQIPGFLDLQLNDQVSNAFKIIIGINF